MRPPARVFLWLFTILLGIDIGAGVYEMRVNVPGWSAAVTTRTSDAEAYMRFAPNAGQRWWIGLTPLLALVTIAALVFAIRSAGPARRWMLRATALELLVLISTFAWFVPTIVQLMTHYRDMPPDLVASQTRAWFAWNHVRAVLSLAAWLAALRAMTLSETQP